MENLNHLSVSKKKVKLAFKCPFCLDIFISGASLIEHLRVHNLVSKSERKSKNTDKDVILPPCYVRLTRCDSLVSNQPRNASTVLEENRNRGENSKNFKTESKEGKKLNGCSKCSKKFHTSYGLQRHFRIHTGEKPFVCPHCSQKFTQLGHINRHIRIVHMKEKNFKCEQCDRSFSESSNLKKHVRIHTGQKPYECRHCGRSFRYSSCLNLHVRTHTGETPYHCKLCNYRSAQKSHLNRHYVGIHKSVNGNP